MPREGGLDEAAPLSCSFLDGARHYSRKQLSGCLDFVFDCLCGLLVQVELQEVLLKTKGLFAAEVSTMHVTPNTHGVSRRVTCRGWIEA